jgi:hypothetical protein
MIVKSKKVIAIRAVYSFANKPTTYSLNQSITSIYLFIYRSGPGLGKPIVAHCQPEGVKYIVV